MLMQKIDGAWVQWTGAPIADTWHPLNIEQLWSDDELAAIGLYKPSSDAVPDGKVATAWAIEDRDGSPVNVPTLADPPPQSWPPLSIVNALDKMGVAKTILANTDDLTKAKFYAADRVLETEPLLLSALQAVGKTIADLKAAM